jgi:hypothetical protein
MSNMIIIVKKIKGGEEPNQRLLKISEMLKKPFKKPPEKLPKKSIFNSGNSYFSMFLQPIDQQYNQNLLEDHQENQNIIGKLDILNYSTDSSEEFQKKIKESQNKNLTARNQLSASARRKIPLQAKRAITTPVNEFQNIHINSDKLMVMNPLGHFNLMGARKSKKQNKNKLTKLLKPEWEIRIALTKHKSLQKLLFNLRMDLNLNQNTLKNRNMNTDFFTNQVNSRFPLCSSKIPMTRNNTSSLMMGESSVNEKNKNIPKQRINKDINFTCNNNYNKINQYFPLSKVCEYKHGLKIHKNVINKIKYRRPLSVD